MKYLLCLLLVSSAFAGSPVNLQQCSVTPSTGGLIGCPTANVSFAPVAPTTLVRSQVAGAQAWRAFSTLQPADLVVSSADGGWHALSSITPALLPVSTPPPVVTPPVTPPPVVTPPPTQNVVITSLDNPQLIVTFSGVPNPGCFMVGATKVCVP